MKAALRVVPVRALLRWFTLRVDRARPDRRSTSPVPERTAWAVHVASRGVPGSTCLSRALALQWLLARHGYRSRLRLGVARPDRSVLAAHAWVELDGRVLIGDDDLERFVRLPELDPVLRPKTDAPHLMMARALHSRRSRPALIQPVWWR